MKLDSKVLLMLSARVLLLLLLAASLTDTRRRGSGRENFLARQNFRYQPGPQRQQQQQQHQQQQQQEETEERALAPLGHAKEREGKSMQFYILLREMSERIRFFFPFSVLSLFSIVQFANSPCVSTSTFTK